MYYKYDSITGRLIGAQHLKAYAPQGLRPLGPGEPVNPYPPTWARSHAASAVAAKQQFAPPSRAVSGAPAGKQATPSSTLYGPVPDRLKRLQAKFQKPDGVPVHLKGGPVDRALYLFTLGLCVVGVLGSLHTVYMLAWPRKSSE